MVKIKLITNLPEKKETVGTSRPESVKVPLILPDQPNTVWVLEYKYSSWGRVYCYYSLSSITPYTKKRYIIDKLTE